MAEYIKRETALRIIDNYAKTVTDDGLVVVNAIKDIISVICPAADVEPVKHGHWIFKERIKLAPTGQIVVAEDGAALALKKHITVKVPYCSICGEHGDCEEDATPYCPDCGAMMDGKEVQE